MKQITFVNLFVCLYVTALFILFQPSVLQLPIDITVQGDQYYFSLFFRFALFFIVAQITMPFVYYFVDHFPHHPDP